MRPIFNRILVGLYLALALVPVTAMLLKVKDHRLDGTFPPGPRPALTVAAVLDDSFQTKLTTWFETSFGLRAWAVWIDNSILYHLFAETRFGSRVALGTDGTLFEGDDINYFNASAAQLPSADHVAALADRIANLQARLRAHGRAFIPVFVPSKTTFYRDKVPALWTRDLGDPRPGTRLVHHAIRDALEARHVTYVDGIDLLTTSTESRDLLWGPGARHFSNYAGCLVVRATLAAYARVTATPPIEYPCIADVKRSKRSHGDLDLFRLVNAWGAARDPVGRDVLHDPLPAAPLAGAPKIMWIATSFGWVTMGDAALSKRFPELHLDYYNSSVFDGGNAQALGSIDPRSEAWRALFLTRDLYVFELHESYVTLGPFGSGYFAMDALDALDEQLPR
ncbi:MAG: hypothetical protein H0T79_18090 [Deltaproteobacteria bacterium]|nr:hypothetical protein [Deltaproteobacteria bacterium]